MFEEPSENWRAPGDAWATSCWARCCSPKPAAITLASADHHRTFVPALVPNNHPRPLRISPIKAELHDMTDLPQSKCKCYTLFYGQPAVSRDLRLDCSGCSDHYTYRTSFENSSYCKQTVWKNWTRNWSSDHFFVFEYEYVKQLTTWWY